LFIFAVLWTGFSVFWEFMAWKSGAPWFFVLFGTPFVAVGIGLMVWAFLPLIVGMKIAKPEVSVSSDILRVGESFRFNYQQTFKRAADVKGIVVSFVFRESATYQRGTDTTTVTHEHEREKFEYPGRPVSAGAMFSEERTLQIPDDAMHTFVARRNKLQWFIKVHVAIAGWPDFKEEYEVKVLPERIR
jgi:hypothetical protein